MHSIFSKDASTTVASENNYFNHCEINFVILDHSKEAVCYSLVHSYTAGERQNAFMPICCIRDNIQLGQRLELFLHTPICTLFCTSTYQPSNNLLFFPHFVAGDPFGPAMGLFMNPYHYTPDIYSGIPGILGAGMPYPGYHGFPFPTPAVHRAPSPNVVTEEDLQKMIQIHRKRRLANEVYRQLQCYQPPRRRPLGFGK